MPTTEQDLTWWLNLADSLDWTFARTYAATAPHEYVVLGRTEGITRDDFIRAAHVIHTFGQPGKFYASTNNYLCTQEWKWWTMDALLDDTDLINRAAVTDEYGAQDAPVTHTGTFTRWDSVATRWDHIRDNDAMDEKVRSQIIDRFGAYAPTTLDVGCGTGALLDTGVVSPHLYTGVDSSQAMLNMLVRKYPHVHRVVPGRFEDVHPLLGQYDLVVAADVPDLDTSLLKEHARDLLIVETR